MPLKKCVKDGKPGYQWGSGHCYNSPDMKENKRKAILQGVSYEGSTKVNKMLKSKVDLSESDITLAEEILAKKPVSWYDEFTSSVQKNLNEKG